MSYSLSSLFRKRATMSKSLSSLFKKERPWVNRSRRSLKKSNESVQCTYSPVKYCEIHQTWNRVTHDSDTHVCILHFTTPHIYHPSQHPEHTQHTSSIELLFNVPKNVFSLRFSNIMNLHNNNSCIACHNTKNSYYPIRTCCVAERCIYLYFIYLFIYLAY